MANSTGSATRPCLANKSFATGLLPITLPSTFADAPSPQREVYQERAPVIGPSASQPATLTCGGACTSPTTCCAQRAHLNDISRLPTLTTVASTPLLRACLPGRGNLYQKRPASARTGGLRNSPLDAAAARESALARGLDSNAIAAAHRCSQEPLLATPAWSQRAAVIGTR
jgi:hypothetical protein